MDARDSLRRIVQLLLNTPGFWRQNELSEQLQRDLVNLAALIDSINPAVARDYACALSELSRHLPDDIARMYEGDLAAMVARTIDRAR